MTAKKESFSQKNINMQNSDITDLAAKYNERLVQNLMLNKFNTWHVGGPADLVYNPKNIKELQSFLADLYQIADKVPICFLGLGSNVLIRDRGIRGIVVFTNNDQGLCNLEIISDKNYGQVISCEAGVPCAKLAKFLAKHDYPVGAFWSGIPGTMGGALAMNAGCYGHETWEYVVGVEVIDRMGKLIKLTPSDFDISYRTVKIKNTLNLSDNPSEFWFVRAILKLPEDKSISGLQEIKNLLHKRSVDQPIGLFSGGSVFRNPTGNYAAKLIDQAGLKDSAIGGARVSNKHANFIINDKTSTAKDIEMLIERVEQTVFEKFGIKLKPEVIILGESSNDSVGDSVAPE
jgi:UDP-N-acetylmuramate dehydrogenase